MRRRRGRSGARAAYAKIESARNALRVNVGERALRVVERERVRERGNALRRGPEDRIRTPAVCVRCAAVARKPDQYGVGSVRAALQRSMRARRTT